MLGVGDESANGLHELVKACEMSEKGHDGNRYKYTREELLKIRECGGGRRFGMRELGLIYDEDSSERLTRILAGHDRMLPRSGVSGGGLGGVGGGIPSGNERWARGVEASGTSSRFEALKRSPHRSPERSPRASPRLMPKRERELVPLDESWLKPHPLLDDDALDGALEAERPLGRRMNGMMRGKMMAPAAPLGFSSKTGENVSGSPKRRTGTNGKNGGNKIQKVYVKMAKGPQGAGGFARRIAFREGLNGKDGVRRRAKSPDQMVAQSGGEIGRLFAMSSKVAPPPVGLSSLSKKMQQDDSMLHQTGGILNRNVKKRHPKQVDDEEFGLQRLQISGTPVESEDEGILLRSKKPDKLSSDQENGQESTIYESQQPSPSEMDTDVSDLLSILRMKMNSSHFGLTPHDSNIAEENPSMSAPELGSANIEGTEKPFTSDHARSASSMNQRTEDLLSTINGRAQQSSPIGPHPMTIAMFEASSSPLQDQTRSRRSSVDRSAATANGSAQYFEDAERQNGGRSAHDIRGEAEPREMGNRASNPEVSSAKSDALDPSVLSFFNSVKEMAISGKRPGGDMNGGAVPAHMTNMNPAIDTQEGVAFGAVRPGASQVENIGPHGLHTNGGPPSGSQFYAAQRTMGGPEGGMRPPYGPQMLSGHPQFDHGSGPMPVPFGSAGGPGQTPGMRQEMIQPQNMGFAGHPGGPNAMRPNQIGGNAMENNVHPVVGATYKPQEFFSMFQAQQQQRPTQQPVPHQIPQQMQQQMQQQQLQHRLRQQQMHQQQMHQQMRQQMAQQRMAGQMPQQVPHQMPQPVSHQMQHQMHHQMVQQRLPQQMMPQMPQQIPQQISQQIPQKAPQHVPPQMAMQIAQQMARQQMAQQSMQQSLQHSMREPQPMYGNQMMDNMAQRPQMQGPMEGRPSENENSFNSEHAMRQQAPQGFPGVPDSQQGEANHEGHLGLEQQGQNRSLLGNGNGVHPQTIPTVGNVSAARAGVWFEQAEKQA